MSKILQKIVGTFLLPVFICSMLIPYSFAESSKITFCHVPPGNEDGANEITTALSAYEA
jgi:hypothetical protein